MQTSFPGSLGPWELSLIGGYFARKFNQSEFVSLRHQYELFSFGAEFQTSLD